MQLYLRSCDAGVHAFYFLRRVAHAPQYHVAEGPVSEAVEGDLGHHPSSVALAIFVAEGDFCAVDALKHIELVARLGVFQGRCGAAAHRDVPGQRCPHRRRRLLLEDLEGLGETKRRVVNSDQVLGR